MAAPTRSTDLQLGSPAEPLIRVRDLTKTYLEGTKRHAVLEGAALDVERGELIAILGRSGSGKSTLLHLLAGLDLPDAGSIHIAGTDLPALSETQRTVFRRRHIGLVFQFFNLVPTLTVSQNLLLPLELTAGLGAAERARAAGILEQVGLGNRASSYPERLSGGEQQRVAIARALVHRPHLILADEPTGNLDADTAAEILALLERLVRDEGRTLVMATHSRGALESTDRVLKIDHGRVVETGTDPAGSLDSTGESGTGP